MTGLRITHIVIFALLAMLLTTSGAIAGGTTLGTAFTYQDRLTDGGTPATGNYDFTFQVYDAATSGAAQGIAIGKDAVSVKDGLFTVDLDFGSNVFKGDAWWLDISVRKSGTTPYTTLTPRQPVRATPYTIYAPSAGTAPWTGLTGVPTGFADNNDNDALGLLTTCATNQVAKWDGTKWACAADTDTNTTYTQGTGLTLSGTEFSVNTATIQQRVGATCDNNTSIRLIFASGAVGCQAEVGPQDREHFRRARARVERERGPRQADHRNNHRRRPAGGYLDRHPDVVFAANGGVQ